MAFLFFTLVAGSGWWLLRQEEAPQAPRARQYPRSRAVAMTALNGYVGDKVCAACHPRIAQLHAQTNHARTLRPAEPETLSSLPRIREQTDGGPRTRYDLRARDGHYLFTAERDGKRLAQRVDYLFGSGTGGMTLVGINGTEGLTEFRMSFFPARKRWEITPGQRHAPAGALGRRHDRTRSQRCFGCHATALADSEVTPSPRFFGVGCESCHGPGRRHAEARDPGGSRTMQRWSAAPAERLNELCAQCHRSESDIDPISVSELQQTQRFQPYGLMKSACFQRGGKTLSCLTCHDPHRNAAREADSYERVCRTCHTGPATARPCPVNPREQCLGCHMPRREVTNGLTMADHWIRIFHKSPPPERGP